MNTEAIDSEVIQHIKVGDAVRSYDFAHRTDCYYEGRVVDTAFIEGCPRYVIRTSACVVLGKDREDLRQELVCPPVNGTLDAMLGSPINSVVKL